MKLSFRKNHDQMPVEPAADNCPHVAMVPRWDSADDIGHEDRATAFRCESCSQVFSPMEAEALRASERARLVHTIGR